MMPKHTQQERAGRSSLNASGKDSPFAGMLTGLAALDQALDRIGRALGPVNGSGRVGT